MIETFVSVIMPTFNTAESFLESAIESILSQTHRNFEFIIIDDGSINNNFGVIKKYKDKRISAYQNVQNQGLPYTLNRAIALSKGKYIVRMDSDDISLPKRLEVMINFLETNERIDIAGSYFKTFDSSHRLVRPPRYNEHIRSTMLFSCPLCHPSIVFRKCSVEKFNIRYTNECKSEDYNLWVRCSLNKEIVFGNVDKVLLKYRIHDEQLTTKEKGAFTSEAIKNQTIILDYLGVILNSKELDLYLKFCLRTGDINSSDFMEIDKILHKIVMSNDEKQLYETNVLKNVIADRFRREYIKRKFKLRQKCGQAYKTFSFKKHASSLMIECLTTLSDNLKNMFV